MATLKDNSVKFRRKRKKFEESAASPGDKVALELEVGSEELEVKGEVSRSPLDELKRIAEGRGESRLHSLWIITVDYLEGL